MYYKLLSALGIIALWSLPLSGQLTVTIAPAGIICEGDAVQLSSTVSGGDGNYNYIWTPAASLSCADCPNPVATPSASTTYTLLVEDGAGATGDNSVLVEVDNANIIDFDNTVITEASCDGGADGAIDLATFGGFGFSFLWTGPLGFTASTEDINNLVAGVYTVTTTTANGCEQTASFTVAQTSGSVTVTGEVVGDLCAEPLSALLDITVEGGTTPYEYIWSDGSTTEDITVSSAGIYSVTVVDANGCSDILDLLVQDNIILNFTVIDATCQGSNDGLVTVNTNASWTYEWSNGNTSPVLQGIAPGTYCLTVTDVVSGCTASDCADVLEPAPLVPNVVVTDVSCAGGTDGSITVFVTGGTPPYAYLWNNGVTTSSINNLPAGTYEVTIVDANGCTASITATILEADTAVDVEVSGIPDQACTEDFTLTANIQGGAAPYAILWLDEGNNVIGTATELVNPGVDVVILAVTDNNGCTYDTLINANYLPTVSISTTGIISCDSGTVTLDGSGSESGPEYTYEWTGPTGSGISDLPTIEVDVPGIYTLTVSNPAIEGCTNSTSVEVVDFSSDFDGSIQVNNVSCGVFTLRGSVPDNYFGEVIFTWTYPSGFTITTSDLNAFEATETGVYTLETHIPGLQCTFYATTYIDLDAQACSTIRGVVRHDTMELCLLNPNDPGLAGWIVSATFDGQTLTTITDENGAYEFTVPLTTGIIGTAAPNPLLWDDCIGVASFNAIEEGEVYEVDFWYKGSDDCAVLDVELGAAFLRRCFTSYYYLSVHNAGTVAATDAELVLELDEFLSYEGASILPTGVVGQNVVWNFDEILPGQSFTIVVQVTVSCDSQLGQTHCSQAYISPNPDCTTANGWTGTNLELEGDCEGNEVIFTVRNTGNTDLSEAVHYIVIEDGVAMSQEQTLEDLGMDQVETFAFPANGSTYTFQLDQVDNHPFSERMSVSVEGCGEDGQSGFSTGFVTQFPQSTASPNIDILCLENIGAYDPNDKGAFPVGYGEEHFIEPETEINYRIRFQNTGTDTAFTVIIRDTLSEWLDLRTLSLGNSSHSYDADIDMSRALTFTFNNILLPDSTTNLEESQGFVDFSISPQLDAPLGTVIENSAAIYFDFNEPVITNTVFHTLGRDFLEVVNTTVNPSYDLSWEIFPNPVQQRLVLDIKGELPEGTQLLIFNALGQLEQTMPVTEGRAETSVQQLTAGWYQLQLRTITGEIVGTAKLVKQ